MNDTELSKDESSPAGSFCVNVRCRRRFVTLLPITKTRNYGTSMLYGIEVRYLRFQWTLWKTGGEIKHLHTMLSLKHHSVERNHHLNLPRNSIGISRWRRLQRKKEAFSAFLAGVVEDPKLWRPPLEIEGSDKDKKIDSEKKGVGCLVPPTLVVSPLPSSNRGLEYAPSPHAIRSAYRANRNLISRPCTTTTSGGTLIAEFFEVGAMSLNPSNGKKGKEGYLHKCSGASSAISGSSVHMGMLHHWKRKWVALHEGGIVYYPSIEHRQPDGILMVDQYFGVEKGGKYIRLSNSSKTLTLRCASKRSASLWRDEIQDYYRDSPRRECIAPLKAFSPLRKGCLCRIFTSGATMMAAATAAILQARHSVFIAGWMVSPDLLMLRPNNPPTKIEQRQGQGQGQGQGRGHGQGGDGDGDGDGDGEGDQPSYREAAAAAAAAAVSSVTGVSSADGFSYGLGPASSGARDSSSGSSSGSSSSAYFEDEGRGGDLEGDVGGQDPSLSGHLDTMKQVPGPGPPVRLSQLLRRKAEEGVDVYILLFQEVAVAMDNASGPAQQVLAGLHPKIHVNRHPNKLLGKSTALLWSHHDKVISVDQRLSFVGGLDLAYGRWDTTEHRLQDATGYYFPQDEFYNPGLANHHLPRHLRKRTGAANSRRRVVGLEEGDSGQSTGVEGEGEAGPGHDREANTDRAEAKAGAGAGAGTGSVRFSDRDGSQEDLFEKKLLAVRGHKDEGDVDVDGDGDGDGAGLDIGVDLDDDIHGDVCGNGDGDYHSEGEAEAGARLDAGNGDAGNCASIDGRRGRGRGRSAKMVSEDHDHISDEEYKQQERRRFKPKWLRRLKRHAKQEDAGERLMRERAEREAIEQSITAFARHRQASKQIRAQRIQKSKGGGAGSEWEKSKRSVESPRENGDVSSASLSELAQHMVVAAAEADTGAGDKADAEAGADWVGPQFRQSLGIVDTGLGGTGGLGAGGAMDLTAANAPEQSTSSDQHHQHDQHAPLLARFAHSSSHKRRIQHLPSHRRHFHEKEGHFHGGLLEAAAHSSSAGGKAEGAVGRNAIHPRETLRYLLPRMPWHDVHACVTGPAARDVAFHFIQRWNHHRLAKRASQLPVLVPATDSYASLQCGNCDALLLDSWEWCRSCGYIVGPAPPTAMCDPRVERGGAESSTVPTAPKTPKAPTAPKKAGRAGADEEAEVLKFAMVKEESPYGASIVSTGVTTIEGPPSVRESTLFGKTMQVVALPPAIAEPKSVETLGSGLPAGSFSAGAGAGAGAGAASDTLGRGSRDDFGRNHALGSSFTSALGEVVGVNSTAVGQAGRRQRRTSITQQNTAQIDQSLDHFEYGTALVKPAPIESSEQVDDDTGEGIRTDSRPHRKSSFSTMLQQFGAIGPSSPKKASMASASGNTSVDDRPCRKSSFGNMLQLPSFNFSIAEDERFRPTSRDRGTSSTESEKLVHFDNINVAPIATAQAASNGMNQGKSVFRRQSILLRSRALFRSVKATALNGADTGDFGRTEKLEAMPESDSSSDKGDSPSIPDSSFLRVRVKPMVGKSTQSKCITVFDDEEKHVTAGDVSEEALSGNASKASALRAVEAALEGANFGGPSDASHLTDQEVIVPELSPELEKLGSALDPSSYPEKNLLESDLKGTSSMGTGTGFCSESTPHFPALFVPDMIRKGQLRYFKGVSKEIPTLRQSYARYYRLPFVTPAAWGKKMSTKIDYFDDTDLIGVDVSQWSDSPFFGPPKDKEKALENENISDLGANSSSEDSEADGGECGEDDFGNFTFRSADDGFCRHYPYYKNRYRALNSLDSHVAVAHPSLGERHSSSSSQPLHYYFYHHRKLVGNEAYKNPHDTHECRNDVGLDMSCGDPDAYCHVFFPLSPQKWYHTSGQDTKKAELGGDNTCSLDQIGRNSRISILHSRQNSAMTRAKVLHSVLSYDNVFKGTGAANKSGDKGSQHAESSEMRPISISSQSRHGRKGMQFKISGAVHSGMYVDFFITFAGNTHLDLIGLGPAAVLRAQHMHSAIDGCVLFISSNYPTGSLNLIEVRATKKKAKTRTVGDNIRGALALLSPKLQLQKAPGLKSNANEEGASKFKEEDQDIITKQCLMPCPGDVLLSLNGDNVTHLSATHIRHVQISAKGPKVMVFRRYFHVYDLCKKIGVIELERSNRVKQLVAKRKGNNSVELPARTSVDEIFESTGSFSDGDGYGEDEDSGGQNGYESSANGMHHEMPFDRNALREKLALDSVTRCLRKAVLAAADVQIGVNIDIIEKDPILLSMLPGMSFNQSSHSKDVGDEVNTRLKMKDLFESGASNGFIGSHDGSSHKVDGVDYFFFHGLGKPEMDVGSKVPTNKLLSNSVVRWVQTNGADRLSYIEDEVDVQIVRSCGLWSLGTGTETSILRAYIHAIETAKHFIYIENQFFISTIVQPNSKKQRSLHLDDDVLVNSRQIVRNRISQALFNRISRAIEASEKFRVMVILPVHPEGNYTVEGPVTAVMHYQFQTICQGNGSLLNILRTAYPDVDLTEYIDFFALRNRGVIINPPHARRSTIGIIKPLPSKRLVSDLIYVHDKLMIVDDSLVIVGSANINDRSMLGDRDSEIAMVITSHVRKVIKMAGKPFSAAAFAHSLRLKLWRQHTAADPASIEDPLSSDAYDKHFFHNAKENSKLYDHIFDGGASMHKAIAPTLKDHKSKLQENADNETEEGHAKAHEHIERVKGHLVMFPLTFLKDEQLNPRALQKKSAIIPENLWT